MQNTTWAIATLPIPALSPIASKKISVAMAVTISGASSGRATSASPAARPGKERPRSKANAAGMASRGEAGVAIAATTRRLTAARRRSSLPSAAANQRVLNPPQISAARLALKA